MKNTKLKTCPFCGGQAKIHEDYMALYLVQCSKCGIGTLHRGTKEEVCKEWNRREHNDTGRD